MRMTFNNMPPAVLVLVCFAVLAIGYGDSATALCKKGRIGEKGEIFSTSAYARCIDFHETNTSWEEAKNTCSEKNFQLAKLTNTRIMVFIHQMSRILQWENYWIGANDKRKSGQWEWDDNTKATGALFAPINTTESKTEYCGLMPTSGRVIRHDCKGHFPFVCTGDKQF